MALVGVAASLMFATSCTKKEAENSEESAPPVAINSAADFAGESVSSSQKESLVNNPWKVFPTLPGSGAVDIGVGANGVVWVIGGLAETGGYGIYYWSSIGWYKVAGAALSIDVDANGNPWIVNNQKEVFKRSNGAWTKVAGSGTARDITVGYDGVVYIVSNMPSPYGAYEVMRWNGYKFVSVSPRAGGLRISAGAKNGVPVYWYITAEDRVLMGSNDFSSAKTEETNAFTLATDVGCGKEGIPYIITKTAATGGFTIQRYVNSVWEEAGGAAVKVDVGANAIPFVVNNIGKIYCQFQ